MLERIRSNLPAGGIYVWAMGPAVIVYATALWLAGQIRIEHLLLMGGWLILTAIPRCRFIVRGLAPFFIFGLVYDALRFVTPIMHRMITPHVGGPWAVEQALFGVHLPDGRVLIPSQVLAQVDSVPLLLAAGFAYFFYIYEVFVLGILMLWMDRELLRRFGWAFLALSVVGFLTWLLYPVAPPWYVEKFGPSVVDLSAASDPARLTAFDSLLGIKVFAGIYSHSSDVFGALPSLHAADPLLAWLFARRLPIGRWHWLLFAFSLLVAFSAVFLGHHYVIDVLLGTVYALGTYFAVEAMFNWQRKSAAAAEASAAVRQAALE